jgi:hypothetical protein
VIPRADANVMDKSPFPLLGFKPWTIHLIAYSLYHMQYSGCINSVLFLYLLTVTNWWLSELDDFYVLLIYSRMIEFLSVPM